MKRNGTRIGEGHFFEQRGVTAAKRAIGSSQSGSGSPSKKPCRNCAAEDVLCQAVLAVAVIENGMFDTMLSAFSANIDRGDRRSDQEIPQRKRRTLGRGKLGELLGLNGLIDREARRSTSLPHQAGSILLPLPVSET
jgi:hypothetical protein